MLPAWAQRISELLAADPSKSVSGLARACGIKQPSVSGWLSEGVKSTKMISGDNLVAAAAYLGVSAEYIMTGRDRGRTMGAPSFISSSNETRFDPEMIAESYAALSEIYLEERGVPFDLTAEPERFVLVYEARSRMTKNPSASDERRFGAKVAEIVRLTGAELHGSRDGLPTEGDDKGRMARRIQRKKG